MILGLTPQQQENLDYRPAQPLSRLVRQVLADQDFISVSENSELLPEEKLYIAWAVIINGAHSKLADAAKLPTKHKVPNFSTLFVAAVKLWREQASEFEQQILRYFDEHCGDGVFDEAALKAYDDPLKRATLAGVKTAELMTKIAITNTLKHQAAEPSHTGVKQLVTRLAHHHLIINAGVAGFTTKDGQLVIGYNQGLSLNDLETAELPFKDQTGILAKKKLGCPIIHSGVAPDLFSTQITTKANRAVSCSRLMPLPNAAGVASALQKIAHFPRSK